MDKPDWVFIVYEYGGEYEDSWERIIAIFYNEETARKYVQIKKEQQESNKEYEYQLYRLGDLDSISENSFFRLEGHRIFMEDDDDNEGTSEEI